MTIIYVGMDVHKDSFSLCCFNPAQNQFFGETKMTADHKQIVKYLHNINEKHGGQLKFRLCYEAGCLGYVLYHRLIDEGFDCSIVAPTTILKGKKRVKTDRLDARSLAQNLAFGTCSTIAIPNAADVQIREFIRMRDDHQRELKRIKQETLAFLLRNGYVTDSTPWTIKHMSWMRSLKLAGILQKVLDAYLESYQTLSERIASMDAEIETISKSSAYQERVGHLRCFKGIETLTAMSLVTEIGDFHRFPKAKNLMSYLGLVPGEDSSSERIRHLPLTKAGNTHVRRLLIEAAQSLVRGQVGSKSKRLKSRQAGQPEKVIRYADHGIIRLQKRYRQMIARGVRHNAAVAAVARELAGFIWGMETNNIAGRV